MKTKIRPNDICHCGSNKKYKHCCRNRLAVKGGANVTHMFAKASQLYQQGKYQEAERQCLAVLAQDAQHAEALHLLGVIALAAQQCDVAEMLLNKSLASEESAATYNDLGLVYATKGESEQAIETYKKALELDPTLDHAYCNLGVSLLSKEELGQAEDCFLQALKHNQYSKDAYGNLANLKHHQKQYKEAMEYIIKAEALSSQDSQIALLKKSIAHMLAAQEGNTTDHAPEEYVARMFDEYADHFDEHLQETLSYQTPKKLAQVIRDMFDEGNASVESILDLGCGTGLAIEALQDFGIQGQEVIGVDLSEKMLEKARSRGGYTELQQEEVLTFLEHAKQQYQLIIAADVFVYIGKLEEIFAAASKRLQTEGLFAFSIEDGVDQPPFTLRSTGRYAHALSYIEELAKENNLAMIVKAKECIRKDHEQLIPGYLIILQK